MTPAEYKVMQRKNLHGQCSAWSHGAKKGNIGNCDLHPDSPGQPGPRGPMGPVGAEVETGRLGEQGQKPGPAETLATLLPRGPPASALGATSCGWMVRFQREGWKSVQAWDRPGS